MINYISNVSVYDTSDNSTVRAGFLRTIKRLSTIGRLV